MKINHWLYRCIVLVLAGIALVQGGSEQVSIDISRFYFHQHISRSEEVYRVWIPCVLSLLLLLEAIFLVVHRRFVKPTSKNL